MPTDAHPSLGSIPGAISSVGRLMMQGGHWARAAALAQQLINDSPDDPEVRSVVRDILSHNVPGWHEGMLADAERNGAYSRAIARAVAGGRTLLDIGTGSGLLAMIAARAGASTVYACESHGALAETARAIAAHNGFRDNFHILQKHSTELDRDRDLDGGVDVIVAEVFGSGLLSEGALRTFQHATTSLGREGAQIIPARATIRVALAWHDYQKVDLANVEGFDLSGFERHLAPSWLVPVGSPTLHLRSEPADLFGFDLGAGTECQNQRVEFSLTCEGGTANGVVRWLRLDLDDQEVYEDVPEHGRRSHWDAWFTPLPAEAADQTNVALGAVHDTDHVYLWAR